MASSNGSDTVTELALEGLVLVGKLTKFGPVTGRDGTVYDYLMKGTVAYETVPGNPQTKEFTVRASDEVGMPTRVIQQIEADQSLLGAYVVVHVAATTSEGSPYANLNGLSIQHAPA